MVTNEISLAAWKNNYIIVYARKGEIDARTIVASFKGADGNNLDLTGKSVTFYAMKPDKTQIYNSCTVDTVNNTASVVLTSQTVSVSGIVECEYQIFEGDELLLKVDGLKLAVDDNIDFSEAIESTSECNALIHAINEAETFCENVGDLEDLTTSEKSTVVGAINEVNAKVIPISKGGTGGTTPTEARTNLEVMTGISLYSNSTGTRGTITLSDAITNYAGIEIFYINSDENERWSTRVWNNGESSFVTNLTTLTPYVSSGENRMKIKSSQITVTTTSITFGTETYVTHRSGSTIVDNYSSQAQAKIYKVVGYKY